jgi:hypothetical protein
MVLALINTVFAQESAEAARAQWDGVGPVTRPVISVEIG